MAAKAAESGRGGMSKSVGGEGSASVDLSPLIQSQQQMQRQLQQLVEHMRNLSSTGGGVVQAPTSSSMNVDLTDQLDAFKREMRQNQRQANNDMLSQVEAIVRDALQKNTSGGSVAPSSSISDAEVARLKREVSQLKTEVAELKEENEKLRKKQSTAAPASRTPAAAPSATGRSSSATTSSPATSAPSPSPRTSSSEMQVTETNSAYELALNLPGVKISDLKISYGSGALELEAKGKTYKFEVEASLIDASGISATLQPNGGLQISVPKKK